MDTDPLKNKNTTTITDEVASPYSRTIEAIPDGAVIHIDDMNDFSKLMTKVLEGKLDPADALSRGLPEPDTGIYKAIDRDGGVHYIDSRMDDYGVRLNNVIEEVGEQTAELESNGIDELHEEIGETALEAVGVEKPDDLTRVKDARAFLESKSYAVSEQNIETERRADAEAAVANIARILGKNGKGGGLLGDALREVSVNPEEIRTALDQKTGNSELRDKVKDYLGIRIRALRGSNPPVFGDRIEKNGEKNIIYAGRYGYDKKSYASEDLVALIALAKLDGSFDTEASASASKIDGKNEGQHRNAADIVLDNFAAEQVQEDSAKTEAVSELMHDVRRMTVDLGNDDIVREMNRFTSDLEEKYQRGLPDRFDTNDIIEDLGRYMSMMHNLNGEIYQLAAHISQLIESAANHLEREEIESVVKKLRDTSTQLDTAVNIVGMVSSKVDELHYDQNAQLEVRSIFIQQIPSALRDVRTALETLE